MGQPGPFQPSNKAPPGNSRSRLQKAWRQGESESPAKPHTKTTASSRSLDHFRKGVSVLEGVSVLKGASVSTGYHQRKFMSSSPPQQIVETSDHWHYQRLFRRINKGFDRCLVIYFWATMWALRKQTFKRNEFVQGFYSDGNLFRFMAIEPDGTVLASRMYEPHVNADLTRIFRWIFTMIETAARSSPSTSPMNRTR